MPRLELVGVHFMPRLGRFRCPLYAWKTVPNHCYLWINFQRDCPQESCGALFSVLDTGLWAALEGPLEASLAPGKRTCTKRGRWPPLSPGAEIAAFRERYPGHRIADLLAFVSGAGSGLRKSFPSANRKRMRRRPEE